MREVKVSQRGSTVVLLTLAVLVAVGLAVAGAYVYHARNNAKSNTSTTAAVSPSGSQLTTAAQSVTPSPGMKTYTDSDGNFSFAYPATWTVVNGGTGSSQGVVYLSHKGASSTSAQGHINPTNEFTMTMSVVPSPDAAYPIASMSDGTVVQKVANGINLWTKTEAKSTHPTNSAGPTVCPGMEIMNAGSTHFSYTLANGKYLTISGGYCETQNSVTTLTYQQQLASADWQAAIAIINSIKFK
jgi:cytoskeletal protein RodZ